jgi:hypothetical protein
MVRIIETPPLSGKDLPNQAEKKKDIVHKISIRSNRQNDIKKWDLASNDAFQHELARYFRTKGLYYERRRKEWNSRRTELKSVGIVRGPDIKHLTQLVASYYWDSKLLGPVAARRELGQLFDGKEYDKIKSTPPELAYQLYLLETILGKCVAELADSKQYIANLARYMTLTLFAVTVRCLQAANALWGHSGFTNILEDELDDPTNQWTRFTKQVIDHIHAYFKKDAERYMKAEGSPLSFVNYFKSQTYVGKFFSGALPTKLRMTAKSLLQE